MAKKHYRSWFGTYTKCSCVKPVNRIPNPPIDKSSTGINVVNVAIDQLNTSMHSHRPCCPWILIWSRSSLGEQFNCFCRYFSFWKIDDWQRNGSWFEELLIWSTNYNYFPIIHKKMQIQLNLVVHRTVAKFRIIRNSMKKSMKKYILANIVMTL